MGTTHSMHDEAAAAAAPAATATAGGHDHAAAVGGGGGLDESTMITPEGVAAHDEWKVACRRLMQPAEPDDPTRLNEILQFTPAEDRSALLHSDVSLKNKDHVSALHVAAGGGKLVIAEWLVQKGADVEAATRVRTGANICALVLHADPTLRRYLVEKAHADIEATTLGGWRPLHEAAKANHAHIIKYLLSRGANTTAATTKDHLNHPEGSTAEQVALKEKNMDIAELIRTHAPVATTITL